MERREQVFVSSTFIDLQEERQAVIQTLLQADCFPAGMELFPASDDEKWDLIRRVIDDSDYYVVVLGGRYGSVDDSGLSFTEKEFDYAVQVGKPVMGFVHGAPGEIPQAKAELKEGARHKLAEFRAKIEKRMVKFWTSPADLAGAVALSLIQTRKTHPAEGWVRAGSALTPEVERELAQLRAQVADLERDAASQAATATHSASNDDLAQGDDVWNMDAHVQYWPEGKPRVRSNLGVFYTQVEITWNDIFGELAPLLINEASESTLDDKLDSVAFLYCEEPPPNAPSDYDEIYKVTCGTEVVHEVKVQFYSLGLIKESEKRHPVNDKSHYWTLTESGKHAMLRLRAIRRSEPDATLESAT